MRGARPERALDPLVRRVLAWRAGERVLVACSGGPDSVALAALLDRLGREDDVEVELGHVNHGVRPSAGQDECVVLAVGARLGRTVAIARPAPARDDEATLRAARYAALLDLARRCGARSIATAHTAEDQTETVLLALFRGTGLEGLAGIAPSRALAPDVALVRPLLRATHAEVATELRRSALPYAIDPSNADPRYRRNALRERLAGVREDFPQLDRAVARCAEIVRDELDQTERGARRRAVRARLRARSALLDVTFAAIDTAAERDGLPPG
ncbi:MAG: tRNA lysidine(34) synthetase TilS [Vulcanimicrobiaceae bacterium]|jgi:tRNA(Ile)-lysidine synthase